MTVRPHEIRLAVFDCDGTLSDGQAAVCEAMEGRSPRPGLLCPTRTPSAERSASACPMRCARSRPARPARARSGGRGLQAGVPPLALARARWSSRCTTASRELLGRLKARGWLLGVATGKSDRGLHSCLVTHGIFDLFVTLQTADRHPSKPDPAMLDAAMGEAGAEPRTR